MTCNSRQMQARSQNLTRSIDGAGWGVGPGMGRELGLEQCSLWSTIFRLKCGFTHRRSKILEFPQYHIGAALLPSYLKCVSGGLQLQIRSVSLWVSRKQLLLTFCSPLLQSLMLQNIKHEFILHRYPTEKNSGVWYLDFCCTATSQLVLLLQISGVKRDERDWIYLLLH